MFIVCRFPEPGSPLAAALTEGDYWTADQALLALLNDRLALLMWGLGGGDLSRKPTPILKPPAERLSGDVMTLGEVDDLVRAMTGREPTP